MAACVHRRLTRGPTGEELVRRGVYEEHQVSAAVIAYLIPRNPGEGAELLFQNPDGRNSMKRLTVAQDTGAAIKGPQWRDIFVGTGHQAGRESGPIKNPDWMIVLMPIQRTFALLPEGES